MASKRATIYLRENTLEAIGKTGEGELSLRIASMISRYREMCRTAMPEFSRAEWCAIMDANNGAQMDILAVEDQITPMIVWANVADSIGLGEKWEIDQAALVKRLQSLSRAELLAVEEACIRFWNHHELETDAALTAAWTKIAEGANEN